MTDAFCIDNQMMVLTSLTIPDNIIDRMTKAKTKEDGLKFGVEIAHEIKEKIDSYVQGYQISAPFGKVDLALNVVK